MKRKLKLTITKVYRQTRVRLDTEFCPVCGQETEILNSSESVRFLEIEDHLFNQLIASGKIHIIETANGNLWICKRSLFK